MPKYNPDLLVALSDQITAYPVLKQLDEKYALSLFSVFTPGIITSIDSEINANPQLLSEAMSLMESAVQLSALYTQDATHDLVTQLCSEIVKLRLMWKKNSGLPAGYKASNASLQQELMSEYFVTSEEDFSLFLNSNPVYLGVYLYVYVRTVAML